MKLFSKNDWEIDSLESWSKEVPKKDWKPGRSAPSLAKFVLSKDGLKHFSNVVNQVLEDEIVIEKAIPEYEVRFDEFRGKGRHHDLGIKAKTIKTKESVFIGVEAKVDEEFGGKISDEYLTSIASKLSGTNTKKPNRIERLLVQNFGEKINKSHFNLRYQLLHATVGTLAANKNDKQEDDTSEFYDISVFYVVVFDTSDYDDEKGKANKKDFDKFIKEIKAKKCLSVGDNNAEVYKATIDGKELILIYETIKLEDK